MLAFPVGEKWMSEERTPKDVCGEATLMFDISWNLFFFSFF